jgi:hypothetical protein
VRHTVTKLSIVFVRFLCAASAVVHHDGTPQRCRHWITGTVVMPFVNMWSVLPFLTVPLSVVMDSHEMPFIKGGLSFRQSCGTSSQILFSEQKC